MASRLVDFYHYTDESSAQDIQRTGHIRPSQASGPDAVLGTGKKGSWGRLFRYFICILNIYMFIGYKP